MQTSLIPISEPAFMATVIDMAERLGWKVCHFHDSRREVRPGVFIGDKQAAGFPDLVMVRGRRLLCAELKKEKGKLTPAQEEWMRVLRNVAECHVWKPSDFDLIEEVLRYPADPMPTWPDPSKPARF
jgi:hypothetical protein